MGLFFMLGLDLWEWSLYLGLIGELMLIVIIGSMQQQQSMISKNLSRVLDQISQCIKTHKIGQNVRLVAVSKTKSVQQIKQAYDAGIRHFGENYVDEIEEKQPKLPLDIKWHFIGHLQSNKIKKVLVSNLDVLETVDRLSLAEKIQKYIEKTDSQRKLNVFIQVKTSEEQTKNGADQKEIQPLYLYIKQKCPNLQFKGLMTIGKQGDLQAFKKMQQYKKMLTTKYAIKEEQFELSMGMSGDFEKAIQYGSTNVRVGSLIFGARNYPKKQEKPQSKQKSPTKL